MDGWVFALLIWLAGSVGMGCVVGLLIHQNGGDA